MAESAPEAGWWDSWYTSAKNKSVEVLEFVKRDLDEFSTAVKSEASNVVSSTTSAFKDTLKLDEPDSTASSMKRSVSSFLGQVSSVLNPSPEDEDEEGMVITDAEPVQLSKFQTLLHSLILNPDTFLTEPAETQSQQYKAWREIVDEQLAVDRLTKMLTASPELHKQYTTLVPDQVSHLAFWERYLFRKALLEDQEAQKEALRRRAEREKHEVENYQWQHDETLGVHVELSEEEQTQLLKEYQHEIEKKRQRPADMAANIDDNHYAPGEGAGEGADGGAEKAAVVEAETKGSNDSSLGESNDDDWEREFDLSEADTAGQPLPSDSAQ